MCIAGPISSYRYSTLFVYPTILQWVFHHYWSDSIVKVDFQSKPSADVTMDLPGALRIIFHLKVYKTD